MTSRTITLSGADEVYELRVAGPGSASRIEVSGSVRPQGGAPRPLTPFDATLAADGDTVTLRDGEGRTWRCTLAGEPGAVWVALRGRTVRLERERPGAARLSQARHATDDEVRAPMTGLLVDVRAAPGARVARDDVVAVMEAMKMEYRLLAPREGTVAEVKAARGDRLEVGALVVRLEKESDRQDDAQDEPAADVRPGGDTP